MDGILSADLVTVQIIPNILKIYGLNCQISCILILIMSKFWYLSVFEYKFVLTSITKLNIKPSVIHDG